MLINKQQNRFVVGGLILAAVVLATVTVVWKNSIGTNSAEVVFAQLVGTKKADKEEKPAGQPKITTGCQKRLDDLRFELFQTRQVILDFTIFLRLQAFLRTAVSQDPRIDPAITQSLEGMGNLGQRLFDALKWLSEKIEADQQNGKITPDLDIWLKSTEKAIALYLEYLVKLRDFAPSSIPDNRYEKLKAKLEEFEKFIKNTRIFWETQLESGPFLPPEEWLRVGPEQPKTKNGGQTVSSVDQTLRLENLIKQLEMQRRFLEKSGAANLDLFDNLINRLKEMRDRKVEPVYVDKTIIISSDPNKAQEINSIIKRSIREISQAWFGKEITPSLLLVVNVIDPDDNAVSFCYRDPKNPFYMISCGESASVPHETAHYLMENYFSPKLLPAWVNEGIATQYDDQERKNKGEQIMREQIANYANRLKTNEIFTNLWRDSKYQIAHDDNREYAVAESMVEFFVSRGGQQKFMKFVSEAMVNGDWETALKKYYEIGSAAHLRQLWQNWAIFKFGRN